jgi:transposase InsO family protein
LVALPDKFIEGAAYSFLDRVLSRFGVPPEVLTDQGREFLGEFKALCKQAMIDHRTTSRDHPEADGLAERMVQTVKRGLRKYSLKKGHHGDWDLQLPWIAMGYRFSKQASLASFSPYYLLFGRHRFYQWQSNKMQTRYWITWMIQTRGREYASNVRNYTRG